MNTCYLFDIDLIERSTHPTFPKLPNHALLKMTTYFKEKGYRVKLVYNSRLIPTFYHDENIYIGSALYTPNLTRFKKRLAHKKFKNQLDIENIKIGTPTDTCHITDIPGLKCDYTEYDKMIKESNVKLDWYPANIGFLTRGCKRHCKFCVNRDKNEITPVNTLDEIYQKKGVYIELLDDNLMAYDKADEAFNQIARFYKKHKIPFKLRNGLDCRVVTEDKLQALSNAKPAFNMLHCAWDDVHNTFIFNNIRRIREVVHPSMTCYMLSGVNINTEAEMRTDLLGLYYRYYLLTYIGVEPYIALFEDDRGEYVNPYWNLYKLVKKQYGFQKNGGLMYLKRNLSKKYTRIADKIIDILDDYSYLVTKTRREIMEDPHFDDNMKAIADEIGVKHYPLTPKTTTKTNKQTKTKTNQ